MRDGVNLSDFWDDLSPVRHKTTKTRDANELPLEIPLRALTISGEHGGLVVDPFAGSGTTLIAALKLGMQFIVCDREPEYCDLMKERIENFKEGVTSLES